MVEHILQFLIYINNYENKICIVIRDLAYNNEYARSKLEQNFKGNKETAANDFATGKIH